MLYLFLEYIIKYYLNSVKWRNLVTQHMSLNKRSVSPTISFIS